MPEEPSDKELVLEGCWSTQGYDFDFLEQNRLSAEFRNNTAKTLTLEVAGHFQTENDLPEYQRSTPNAIIIRPQNRALIEIPFVADLSLVPFTNSFYLTVKYRYEGEKVSNEGTFYPNPSYMSIHPVRQTGRHFFISHKDPEDWKMASKLDHYLQKVGFSGYIVEEHRMPGADLWNENIIPAIRETLGVIVLWTRQAADDGEQIVKEIDLAKQFGKRRVLMRQTGVELPENVSKEIGYFPAAKTGISVSDLVDLVKSIDESYRTGLF